MEVGTNEVWATSLEPFPTYSVERSRPTIPLHWRANVSYLKWSSACYHIPMIHLTENCCWRSWDGNGKSDARERALTVGIDPCGTFCFSSIPPRWYDCASVSAWHSHRGANYSALRPRSAGESDHVGAIQPKEISADLCAWEKNRRASLPGINKNLTSTYFVTLAAPSDSAANTYHQRYSHFTRELTKHLPIGWFVTSIIIHSMNTPVQFEYVVFNNRFRIVLIAKIWTHSSSRSTVAAMWSSPTDGRLIWRRKKLNKNAQWKLFNNL